MTTESDAIKIKARRRARRRLILAAIALFALFACLILSATAWRNHTTPASAPIVTATPTAVPQIIIIHTSPPRNPDTAGNHQLIHIQADPELLKNIGIAYLGHDGRVIEEITCPIPQGLGCIYLAPAVPATSPFHVFWEEGAGRNYQSANPNDNPILIQPMNTVEEILPDNYFDQ